MEGPIVYGSPRSQDQLRAAEHCDRPLLAVVDGGVPYLGRPTPVEETSCADNFSRRGGAEKVRLQLDGGETAGPGGKRPGAAVPARGIGKSSNGPAVEKPVRGEMVLFNLKARLQPSVAGGGDPDAQTPR